MTACETGVDKTADTGPTLHIPSYQDGVAAISLLAETLSLPYYASPTQLELTPNQEQYSVDNGNQSPVSLYMSSHDMRVYYTL